MFDNKQPLFETKAVSKATDQLMSVQTEQTITSLEVAELTGKQHAHIMRDIRNIVSQLGEGAQSKIGLSEYKDTTGRTLPCYRLTKERARRHSYHPISDGRNQSAEFSADFLHRLSKP